MADWDKMALMHLLIGYEAEILGIITYSVNHDWHRIHTIQGLLIVAFVLYTLGAAALAAAKMAGAMANVLVSVFVMICMFVTGCFLVIGVGLYDLNTVWVPYSATLMMSAAFLAFLTLIFLIVHLCTRDSHTVTSSTTNA